jgi:twitching motility protein PilT
MSHTAVASLIRERKTFQLISVIQTGRREGMQTMEDAVSRLVRDGIVSAEEASAYMTIRDMPAAAGRPAPAKAEAA